MDTDDLRLFLNKVQSFVKFTSTVYVLDVGPAFACDNQSSFWPVEACIIVEWTAHSDHPRHQRQVAEGKRGRMMSGKWTET